MRINGVVACSCLPGVPLVTRESPDPVCSGARLCVKRTGGFLQRERKFTPFLGRPCPSPDASWRRPPLPPGLGTWGKRLHTTGTCTRRDWGEGFSTLGLCPRSHPVSALCFPRHPPQTLRPRAFPPPPPFHCPWETRSRLIESPAQRGCRSLSWLPVVWVPIKLSMLRTQTEPICNTSPPHSPIPCVLRNPRKKRPPPKPQVSSPT